VLEYCYSKEELNIREKFWISELSATTLGYNIANGGGGGDLFNCLSEEDKKNNITLKKIIAKNKNIMHEKTVFDCWVDRYGVCVANEKLKEYQDKQSLIQKQKYISKKQKIKDDYGQIILSLYQNHTIDEIHKELSGIASKKIIRELLKEMGVNTLSRNGINSGSKNGNSLLSCEDVINIYSLKGVKKAIELSKDYSISVTQIYNIFNKKSYKDCL
jgi:Mor family transcriptional regulator